jgi:hypothetical protein
MGRRIRSKLSYANIAATAALFIALGGTGYAALTLPRDSVGAAQIRTRSVGPSELRSRAVNSRVIRNNSIRLNDISTVARDALHGAQGPAGPPGMPFRAAVSSGGVTALGNARTVDHVSGTNLYRIDFGRNPTNCIFSATLAAVQAGPVLEQPEAGRITVSRDSTHVLVRTFGATGAAAEQPFHLAMAC